MKSNNINERSENLIARFVNFCNNFWNLLKFQLKNADIFIKSE